MLEADTIDHFLRIPVGRWAAGNTFVAWCAQPDLTGMANFGERTSADSSEVLRCFHILEHPSLDGGRIRAVLDYRRLQGLTTESYTQMAAFMRDAHAQVTARLARLVVIVQPTQVGAVVAGTVSLMGYANPARVVGTELEAAELLGPGSAAVLDEVEQRVAERNGALNVLNTVRSYLRTEPAGATLEEAARRAKVSVRTLQRELRSSDSSFRQEQLAARAAYAAQRLQESDEKIEAIARAAGCSSSSHLSTLLKRVYGMTAAEYRQRQRPA